MFRSPLVGCVLVVLAATATSAAAQQGVQITEEAITQACRDMHGVSNVQSGKLEIGPGGNLVLNCRLVNVSGVTLAQVSFEQVCYKMTGSHDWYRGMGMQVFCRGGQAAQPDPTPATAASSPGPAGAGDGGDIALTPARLAQACGAVRGGSDAAAQLRWAHWFEPVITCGGVQVTPEQLCPHVTGRTNWYVGEQSPPPAPMGISVANVTCRGSGPRQFIALAHIQRYCKSRGYAYGSNMIGALHEPICGPKQTGISFAASQMCRDQYGTSAAQARGVLYWCPP